MRRVLTAIATTVIALPAWAESPVAMTGAYVWGHEVSAFQHCGTTRVSWLQGDEDTMALLTANAAPVIAQHGPYTPIWIAIEARPVTATGAFARDYDGVLEITRLLDLSPDIPPGCDLPQEH